MYISVSHTQVQDVSHYLHTQVCVFSTSYGFVCNSAVFRKFDILVDGFQMCRIRLTTSSVMWLATSGAWPNKVALSCVLDNYDA